VANSALDYRANDGSPDSPFALPDLVIWQGRLPTHRVSFALLRLLVEKRMGECPTDGDDGNRRRSGDVFTGTYWPSAPLNSIHTNCSIACGLQGEVDDVY